MRRFFVEAKNGNQFWQGKTDGNSGVKCQLLLRSGLGPPTTGFTSHSEAVLWFYVQHPPSHLACSQAPALSTLYCPQLQCISFLEPSLSALSMQAQLFTAPKQNGRPCDQCPFFCYLLELKFTATHIYEEYMTVSMLPACWPHFMLDHLLWDTAGKQCFGANRPYPASLNSTNWQKQSLSHPIFYISLSWPSSPHHHPSSSPPLTTALLQACSGLPQSPGGEHPTSRWSGLLQCA